MGGEAFEIRGEPLLADAGDGPDRHVPRPGEPGAVAGMVGTAFAGQQRMNALLLVDGFVRQHVRQSSQMGMLGTVPDGPSYESMLAVLTTPDTHPGIRAALAEMSDGDDTDFFTEQLDFGLSVIVAGLAAQLDR